MWQCRDDLDRITVTFTKHNIAVAGCHRRIREIIETRLQLQKVAQGSREIQRGRTGTRTGGNGSPTRAEHMPVVARGILNDSERRDMSLTSVLLKRPKTDLSRRAGSNHRTIQQQTANQEDNI